MKYFLKCWKHYADFKGRARRREYWSFSCACIVISMVLSIVYTIGLIVQRVDYGYFDIVSGSSDYIGFLFHGEGWVSVVAYVLIAFSVASILPWYALVVRRLHDVGLSGYWALFFLLSIVSPIVDIIHVDSFALKTTFLVIETIIDWFIVALWVVFGCFKGQEGENKYGPDPKVEEI